MKLWATHPEARETPLPGALRGAGTRSVRPPPGVGSSREVPPASRRRDPEQQMVFSAPVAAWAQDQGLRLCCGKHSPGAPGVADTLTSRAGALQGLHAAGGVSRPRRPCSGGDAARLPAPGSRRSASGSSRGGRGGGEELVGRGAQLLRGPGHPILPPPAAQVRPRLPHARPLSDLGLRTPPPPTPNPRTHRDLTAAFQPGAYAPPAVARSVSYESALRTGRGKGGDYSLGPLHIELHVVINVTEKH